MKKAARDYVVQFGSAMAAYAAVLLASTLYIQGAHPASPFRELIALLPVIPTVFALTAFVRFLGRMDELQHKLQLEALGFAFGAVGILSFAYGFLENIGFPHVSYIWVLPAMVAFWGIGGIVASARYR